MNTVVHDLDSVVQMIDAVAAKPNRPLRYKQPKAIESAIISILGSPSKWRTARKPRD